MNHKYVNELTVRTVGPALVCVIELEAPGRFEVFPGTRAEFERLRGWSDIDDQAHAVSRAFFEHEDPAEIDRADRHADRLAVTSPLTSCERVL